MKVSRSLVLTPSTLPADSFFTPFEAFGAAYSLPAKFTFPYNNDPHPVSLLAAEMLQAHLESQQDWEHNFGLSDDSENVIGKMFGVLVVETEHAQIGYISAFSGKLAGGNHHAKFVPPIFDGVAKDGFLNAGMTALSQMNDEIKTLEAHEDKAFETHITQLKIIRKKHSVSLQNAIFDQYNFLNQAGEQKSLREIFADASYKNPPAGAGECAAPKLLQYAFQNKMKPLALAEFWWGMSPKSEFWKHGHFYPACREKCAPILAHMLSGSQPH
ncbi:pseudouridylate synthase [Dyadobacter fanqingshengii]|uniref:Pseudouridylate synthase n=1 Tax=Dyadobacter fanqingshengii TaxID=2906443 RepID=A0A9X1P9G6_9BACT|nr:pseudouridylate synthase [Dyadobacter fanqingshengii]MCF0040480.1 pseudouridylate synthase [Dyadobacter fanqingshengii]MCF2501915.1 pseudouridylate synthase [Dyadobacter fanqingshengii]USJ37778.1 pseudouridylate synthase [Dyadobacter fanqingshengii]